MAHKWFLAGSVKAEEEHKHFIAAQKSDANQVGGNVTRLAAPNAVNY